jgi:hypothetical protein
VAPRQDTEGNALAIEEYQRLSQTGDGDNTRSPAINLSIVKDESPDKVDLSELPLNAAELLRASRSAKRARPGGIPAQGQLRWPHLEPTAEGQFRRTDSSVRGVESSEELPAQGAASLKATLTSGKSKPKVTKVKRSLSDVEKDLQDNQREQGSNYKDDFGRWVEFQRIYQDQISQMSDSDWLRSKPGHGEARLLPPFNIQILRKFSAYLLVHFSRETMIQYRYALNDTYERAGLERPWLNSADGHSGHRIFDRLMHEYADQRAAYDKVERITRKPGGAKTFHEDGLRWLLQNGEHLSEQMAEAQSKIEAGSINLKTRQAKDELLQRFGKNMMCTTATIAILRSCSMLWPESMTDYISFSETGAMTILAYNWKETQANPAAVEPRPIIIPAPSMEEPGHPRARYLKLMRTLLDSGGTMTFIKSVIPVKPGEDLVSAKKARKKLRVSAGQRISESQAEKELAPQFMQILHDTFGGSEKANAFCSPGQAISAHSCRKTGASLATLVGANEVALTNLGMWSIKSGIPKTYRNLSLQTSSFSVAMYDWLRR